MCVLQAMLLCARMCGMPIIESAALAATAGGGGPAGGADGAHRQSTRSPDRSPGPTRVRPVGPMDKASASGAGDSRFESWAGQKLYCNINMQHVHASQNSAAGN